MAINMIPIILVTREKNIGEKYISDYVSAKKIDPFYIFRINPINQSISIDQVREVDAFLQNSPRERPLFIIYSFDTARGEAQSAFLKTLEEKQTLAQFILMVENPGLLLATVIDRCRVINLGHTQSSKKTKELEFNFDQTSHNELLKKFSGISREESINVFDQLIVFLKKELITKQSKYKLIKEVLMVRHNVSTNNINPQIAIDHVVSKFIKSS